MRLIQALAVAVLAVTINAPASTQTAPGTTHAVVPLHGRHTIALSIGLMDHVARIVSVTGRGVSVNSEGAFWVGYGHWFGPDWAVVAETGAFATQVRVSGDGTETAMLFPIVFGLRYQPEDWALDDRIRPYVEGAAGPYFGLQTETGWAVEVGWQTATGARLSAGVDLFASRQISLGTVIRYHAITDFARTIGSRDNYSGFEFSLRLGILLGTGR